MANTFSVDLITEETGKGIKAAEEMQAKALLKIAGKMGAYDNADNWMEYQAYIRAGLAGQVSPPGALIPVQKETGLSVTVTGGVTSATVDEDTFLLKTGHAGTAAYEFIFDGAAWHLDGEAVEMSQYGITVSGTPAEGDAVVVHEVASEIMFEVVSLDYDVPVNVYLEHSVSLYTRDLLLYGSIPFCSPQALFSVTSDDYPNGLTAGSKYYITLDHACYDGTTKEDGDYHFEAPVDVPVGGKIRHTTMGGWLSDSSGYIPAHITNGTFIIYDANYNNIAQNVPCVAGAEGTLLGVATASNPQYRTSAHMNFTQRQIYGSNRYAHSANRKWLNSDAPGAASGQIASWWTASDEFDMPVRSTLPGFLHGMDPAFLAIVAPVRKRTTLSIADGYGYEDTEELVFEPSMTELGLGKNNNISEVGVNADGTLKKDAAWDLFVTATQEDRIKYHAGVARYYWLRSPIPSSALNERYVIPSGALNFSYAHYSLGRGVGWPGFSIIGNQTARRDAADRRVPRALF